MKARAPCPHIDYGYIRAYAGRDDQVKRDMRAVLEPTCLGLLLGLKDAFPPVRVIGLGYATFQRSTLRRRSALVMTETDERLIAAAAIIGDSRSPVAG